MKVWIEPSDLEGSLRVPPSKSLGHRALMCAGLADGESVITHLGHSKDMEATIGCLQALGAHIEEDPGSGPLFRTLHIRGCNPAKNDPQKPAVLDAFESGSTIRFLIPIAAAGPEEVRFLGKPSLLSRPMGVYANIFAEQNLKFEQSGEAITFQGPLKSGLFTLDGSISSQFISGLLMSAPLIGGAEIAVLPPYQSQSYVRLTADMMKTFGVHIEEPSENGYRITPDQHYQPASVSIEADWSQAAFFLVAGALGASIVVEGLNPDSLQGDAVITQAIEKAGGTLHWTSQGLQAVKGRLHGFTFDLADCPDLGPILCVLGACCPGETVLTHASRLRYKECDRIAAMEDELRKWGVDITSTEDEIIIHGQSSYCLDHPAVVDSHNDHRIAMAMAIFGLCAKSPEQIQDAQAVTKSYPHFFNDLLALKGKVVRS